jgi:hypothetical protein
VAAWPYRIGRFFAGAWKATVWNIRFACHRASVIGRPENKLIVRGSAALTHVTVVAAIAIVTATTAIVIAIVVIAIVVVAIVVVAIVVLAIVVEIVVPVVAAAQEMLA